ncbi:MAG: helix-turn-helix transcriptional regulator [Gammaproteobacteria bacterium]
MIQKISSRQHQILQLLLENREGLSIDNIAKAMDISRTAVQQHFVGIESEGYIKKSTLNKTFGRPVTVYAITDKGINYFPKQYAWFSELLLTELQEEMGQKRFKAYMQRLGRKLGEKIRARFQGQELDKRMDELLSIMSELGYQVEAEADAHDSPGHFNIRAHNCVYHDLALKHHEICDFDVALISTLLDRDVNQSTCMANGDCACNFHIRKTGESDS